MSKQKVQLTRKQHAELIYKATMQLIPECTDNFDYICDLIQTTDTETYIEFKWYIKEAFITLSEIINTIKTIEDDYITPE